MQFFHVYESWCTVDHVTRCAGGTYDGPQDRRERNKGGSFAGYQWLLSANLNTRHQYGVSTDLCKP